MLSKLYGKWGITERTNFRRMRSEDYPSLSDLYGLIEAEYKSYDMAAHQLYTEQILREVLLGLHSMCKGADAQFFNGHTNITSSRFLVFGVKGLLGAAKNVRNAMLFNILCTPPRSGHRGQRGWGSPPSAYGGNWSAL